MKSMNSFIIPIVLVILRPETMTGKDISIYGTELTPHCIGIMMHFSENLFQNFGSIPSNYIPNECILSDLLQHHIHIYV